MPSIRIGERVLSYEGSKTIMQVAMEHGVEIPRYCYHPGLSVVASCRICLAEVSQPNPKTGELQLIPKLVPTCQHPAVDGTVVHMESAKTVANQKAVMEYLLINHPLDCPVCDQAGECKLQDYSYVYGRAASRFEETKVKQPKKDIGPNVLLYSDRCIMCDRCVRFTKEVTGTKELGRFQRGNRTEINVFPGKPLDNELSGNVVDICPVGALLDKQFLFEQRVWFLRPVASIDPITASGDNLWLDVNQEKVWRVRPRENAEVNKWWTSDEIRYGWKFVHSPDRLRRPRVKGVADEGAETGALPDWNGALQAAVKGLRGKRVGLMVSPMISCEDAYLLGKFVSGMDSEAVIGAGPVPRLGKDKTFPGGYTIYAEKAPNKNGVKRAVDSFVSGRAAPAHKKLYEQFEECDAVVLTGNYPSPWVTDELFEAVKGKFIVLIDTLDDRLVKKANVVLPSATWAEKSGTFENASGRLQVFEQAIKPLDFVRSEAQIALDLMATAGMNPSWRFDAAVTRAEMGGVFVEQVHLPVTGDARKPEVAFAEI